MMPTVLRIVGKDWVINKAASNFTDAGECHRDSLTITINPNQPEENLKDTLLHEVIHAVDYSMSTDLTEKQVAALATGLFAVFQDNPSFLEYLNARPSDDLRGNSDTTAKPRRKSRSTK